MPVSIRKDFGVGWIRVIPTLSPSTSPIKPEKYNTYQHQGGHEHVVLLATPSTNMGTSPIQFSAVQASLTLTGTRLLPSQPSSGRPEILPGSLPSDTDSDNAYTAATASELDDNT